VTCNNFLVCTKYFIYKNFTGRIYLFTNPEVILKNIIFYCFRRLLFSRARRLIMDIQKTNGMFFLKSKRFQLKLNVKRLQISEMLRVILIKLTEKNLSGIDYGVSNEP
jgi:hypothetical protein